MITVKDIAKATGVSATTVSRVINNSGYVGEKTKRKVEKALNDLNYKPNALARSLVSQRSNSIALIHQDIGTVFFAKLVNGIQEEIHRAGYQLIICNSNQNIQQETDYLKMVQENRVAGILIIPVAMHNPELAVMVKQRFPVVTIARQVDDVAVDSVVADNLGGSYTCIQHLVKLGHKRIGIINGPQTTSTGRDRWLGVKRAFEEFNIPYSAELIRESAFTIKSGFNETLALLKLPERPTAIFAANNLMAAGVLQALRAEGLSVPDDMSVVGFEGFDDLDFGLIINPALTANIHPSREMGRVGVRLLLAKIAEKSEPDQNLNPVAAQEIKLKTEFVVRESCKAIG